MTDAETIAALEKLLAQCQIMFQDRERILALKEIASRELREQNRRLKDIIAAWDSTQRRG
jgi:hypothetical protein